MASKRRGLRGMTSRTSMNGKRLSRNLRTAQRSSRAMRRSVKRRGY